MKIDRRKFLKNIGLGSLISVLAGQIYAWIRSLFPNVSYEGARRVKLDEPNKIPDGVTFIDDIKTYIFRENNTFYAISAVCTHLGCTVKYVGLSKPKIVKIGGKEVEIKWEFHCPCHGSKFYGDGTNYAGPAPRPLEWVKVEISKEDGKLVVDLDKTVPQNYKVTV